MGAKSTRQVGNQHVAPEEDSPGAGDNQNPMHFVLASYDP